jgi:hypothetical protein
VLLDALPRQASYDEPVEHHRTVGLVVGHHAIVHRGPDRNSSAQARGSVVLTGLVAVPCPVDTPTTRTTSAPAAYRLNIKLSLDPQINRVGQRRVNEKSAS